MVKMKENTLKYILKWKARNPLYNIYTKIKLYIMYIFKK